MIRGQFQRFKIIDTKGNQRVLLWNMDSSLNEKKLKNSRSINDHNSDLFSIHKVRGKHKDIPYNEVYFPKLQISPSYLNSNDIYRSNEMDAMWMVGVLDSSDRSRKNKVNSSDLVL